MTRRFVIWSWSFDDTTGGMIALHLLCRRLNELGVPAMLWDAMRPVVRPGVRPLDWLRLARYRLRRLGGRGWRNPFGSPLARTRDLADAVVVYPEVVGGNPLDAAHVVRWLLHRPGQHSGETSFGAHDLFFFYQEAFDNPAINPDPSNRLTLTWFIDDYRRHEITERQGSAYLIRKGKGRPLVHDLTDSVCVDDLSHAERAAVFNRVERFYCYDLYTMYALYAALCGCLPIVVPDPALTKEQWTPDERDRYGIAYGEQDIAWAMASRDLLVERLRSVRAEQDAHVRSLVAKCEARFG